ncbi:MAG: protein-export chaperone SecB [Bacteroidales bacterium]|nr:protein-export chaperone SecB [Bacteroidales bacterium]
MKIQLKNWIVKDLNITNLSGQEDTFNFAVGASFCDSQRDFNIGFKVEVNNTNFKLTAEIVFNFSTDTDIDSQFKNSSFVKINAPAIAFPYVRTIITTITMQCGYQGVILPSVNFVNLAGK